MKYLRKRSKGQEVRALQFRVNELGFYPGPIDGAFGTLTHNAVVRFQTFRQIAVDGIVGPQTNRELYDDTDMQQLKSALARQIGKRYIFGHEVFLADPNPKAFDCSELVQWAFYQIDGKDFGDGSYNQFDTSHAVKERPLIVGDLLFLRSRIYRRINHVAIYVGDGQIIEARGRLFGVVNSPVSRLTNSGRFAGARRFGGI